MSQFPGNPYASYGEEPQVKKTSGVAITALVFSILGIIPCCGAITAPIGVLLGLIGVATLGANATKKGRGLAVSAVVVGIILTTVQIVVLVVGYNTFIKPVTEGPKSALASGYSGDTAAFKAHFEGAGAKASDAEAKLFIETLRSRYGEFVSVRFDDSRRQPVQTGQPEVEFPYAFTFKGKVVAANAQYIFADPNGGGFVFKWGYIEVLDPDLGNVRYPASASSTGVTPMVPLQPSVPIETPPDDPTTPSDS